MGRGARAREGVPAREVAAARRRYCGSLRSLRRGLCGPIRGLLLCRKHPGAHATRRRPSGALAWSQSTTLEPDRPKRPLRSRRNYGSAFPLDQRNTAGQRPRRVGAVEARRHGHRTRGRQSLLQVPGDAALLRAWACGWVVQGGRRGPTSGAADHSAARGGGSHEPSTYDQNARSNSAHWRGCHATCRGSCPGCCAKRSAINVHPANAAKVASTAAPQANVGNSERALAAAPTPTKAATNAMNSSPGKSALRRPDLLTRSRALSIAPDRDADKLIPYDDSRTGPILIA